MLSFLWNRLAALVSTLLLVLILLALYGGYRYASHHQEDDGDRLAGKQAYLALLSEQPVNAEPPNIIFILYDDLGYGDIGYGARDNLIATPQLDRLAANGVSLSDFHSPAPVCTPSRAGFLTGRLPLRAGLPNVVFLGLGLLGLAKTSK